MTSRRCRDRSARAKLRLAALGLLVSFGGGCGSQLIGTWKADPAPRGETFYVREAVFREDQTFAASARRGKEDVRMEGKYEYDGTTLLLRPRGRPERRYRATLWWGRTLALTVADRKFTMKKQ